LDASWGSPYQPLGGSCLGGHRAFRGNKLVHEHIYWDQASVLVQIGLLNQIGLPLSGAESAHKVLNPMLLHEQAPFIRT
jgi:hypothetical protein